MSSALDTPLADVLTTLEVDDIAFVRPDVATVACLKHVHDRRESAPRGEGPAMPERARVTFVLAKDAGTWLVASVQTTPVLT